MKWFVEKRIVSREYGIVKAKSEKEAMEIFQELPSHKKEFEDGWAGDIQAFSQRKKDYKYIKNDKALNELMWIFKKYDVPCKPIKGGLEVKHIGTNSNKCVDDKNKK